MTGTYTPPIIDWLAIAPVLTVMLAAVVGVLIEAFGPRGKTRWVQVALSLLALLVAFVFITVLWGGEARASVLVMFGQGGAAYGLVSDSITLFLQGSLVIMGALSVLTLSDRGGSALDAIAADPATRPDSEAERLAERAGRQTLEIFPLMLFAIGGMMIFSSAADLLTMFVALEVFSLPLYIMCGLSRYQRLKSQEAALKYFLLGAFSSAIFLFGIALMYGAGQSISLNVISSVLGNQQFAAAQQAGIVAPTTLFVLAIILMLVGLLFKVGAVPFHSWTPDVYEGAPTPITGFMAACTKAAAFGLLLRLVVPIWSGIFSPFNALLSPALIAVSALTMLIGSVIAIRQTDVKRMLAYSAVAHAGFILCGLVSFQALAIRGVLFYVLVYGLSSIAAFAIVSLVRVDNGDGTIGPEARNLDQWNGLGRRSPLVAAAFSVLMLAFAGFPLTSGFIAKFGVFSAAISTGKTPLVALAVLGVIMSAVAASFYLRVIVRMYFSDPDEAGDSTIVIGGGMTVLAIVVGTVSTVLFGVLPSPLLDAAGALLVAR